MRGGKIYPMDSPGEGLWLMGTRLGEQLWTSHVARKTSSCEICGLPVCIGERALRPITNRENRWQRAHESCAIRLLRG